MSDLTYDLSLLEESRAKWNRSPAVRGYYRDVFEEMMSYTSSGDSLDLGSGIGTIKDFFPEVVTSDIQATPFVDRAVSCYRIQDTGRLWSNLTAMDVLHHLRYPRAFFESAASVLAPGGRMILSEPAATLLGKAFYTICHHEPIAPIGLAPPFAFDPNQPGGEFANMGMGMALFRRYYVDWEPIIRDLGFTLVDIRYRDCIAYPLTGGFSKPQLAPRWLIDRLLGLEKLVPQAVMRLIALRMIIVLERVDADA
jgi:SAM-dependent methyltransferase